jgi:putative ABC transport system substrate-binding protein
LGTAAIYLAGVRILLLQLISSRKDRANFRNLLHLANPVRLGWLVLCLSFLCADQADAQPSAKSGQLSITVMESENSGHYLEFTNALREIIAAQDIDLSVTDPSGPVRSSALVIGVGMKAAASAAASDAPMVLNVLIPQSGYEQLLQEFPLRAKAHTLSAIFLDQPISRQVELIAAALPKVRAVGVLYDSPPAELAQLRKMTAAHGLELHEQQVTPMLPLPDALQAVLRHIKVLLALPDPGIYNSSTIRNILLATYRSDIPLVGFSPGYVNAGALYAAYSTPKQIAAQAAGLIRQLADTGRLPDAEYPQDFEIQVNDQVARSLGIQVSEPSVLLEDVKAAERKAQ